MYHFSVFKIYKDSLQNSLIGQDPGIARADFHYCNGAFTFLPAPEVGLLGEIYTKTLVNFHEGFFCLK